MACEFKYVLLKFTSGKDKGKMSVLDLETVRGSDKMEFNSEGILQNTDSDFVVVEWRAGKKDHKKGWPLFDARLLRAG